MRRTTVLGGLLALGALVLPGLVGAAPLLLTGEPARAGLPGCADGVVKDDGTVESGYGWIPSVVEGIYVQQFRGDELESGRVDRVCLCWLRSQADTSLDYEVVFYEDVDGIPAATPFASFPATASGVPYAVASGGAFYEVEVPDLVVPRGVFYVGARWDASRDQYFFLCADRSPTTEPVLGFYIDDRADEWTSTLDTPDPIFDDYRALMIRPASGRQPAAAVPALDRFGLAALLAAIAAAGVAVLLRSRAA